MCGSVPVSLGRPSRELQVSSAPAHPVGGWKTSEGREERGGGGGGERG